MQHRAADFSRRVIAEVSRGRPVRGSLPAALPEFRLWHETADPGCPLCGRSWRESGHCSPVIARAFAQRPKGPAQHDAGGLGKIETLSRSQNSAIAFMP